MECTRRERAGERSFAPFGSKRQARAKVASRTSYSYTARYKNMGYPSGPTSSQYCLDQHGKETIDMGLVSRLRVFLFTFSGIPLSFWPVFSLRGIKSHSFAIRFCLVDYLQPRPFHIPCFFHPCRYMGYSLVVRIEKMCLAWVEWLASCFFGTLYLSLSLLFLSLFVSCVVESISVGAAKGCTLRLLGEKACYVLGWKRCPGRRLLRGYLYTFCILVLSNREFVVCWYCLEGMVSSWWLGSTGTRLRLLTESVTRIIVAGQMGVTAWLEI